MKVLATPGTRCPKEGKPREFITDQKPVEVSDSAFYLRLVADGSLILQDLLDVATEIIKDKGGKK